MNALSTDINRLHAEGKTYEDIRMIHGVCYDTIKRALSGHDVTVRRKGVRPRTRGQRALSLKDSIEPCPQDVLESSSVKPKNCSDARWRMELSRRVMQKQGRLEYAISPEFLR